MSDFQDPSNIDLNTEAPITFQTAKLLKHFPKHLIQKALSLTPLQNLCGHASPPKVAETISHNLTAKTISILENKNRPEGEPSPEEQDSPDSPEESKPTRLLKKLARKVKKFLSDPFASIEKGFCKFLGMCRNLFDNICSAVSEIPEMIKMACSKAINFIKGVAKSVADTVTDLKIDIVKLIDKKLLWFSGSGSSVFKTVNGNSADRELDYWKTLVLDDRQEEKTKDPLALLLAGLKQIAEALFEKRHKQEHENCIEHARQEDLKNQAKENATKAQSLRPELAEYIHLPETDFLFASPLNQVPSVMTLIEQAEKDAKNSKVH